METKSIGKIKLNHFETSLELAEIKVAYKSKQKNKVKITDSKDSFNVLYPLYDQDTIEYQEQFYLLLLNRATFVLGWVKLSMGGTAGTVVDPKIVFAIALQTNASCILISHNHPSGNINPSENDISLTKNLKASGDMLDIRLLDHIIIASNENYYSFADKGMLE
jgi:DNA repair protein RadC